MDSNSPSHDPKRSLSDLKQKSASGGKQALLTQAVQFGLNFLTLAILARLITKEDFGLVALVAIILQFVELLKDGGLSAATIQQENMEHGHFSSLFWVNIAGGAFGAILMATAGPLMAWLYSDARLIPICLAMSIVPLVGGPQIQHLAMLRRELNFAAITLIVIASSVIGAILGVSSAIFGFGYWALIIQAIAKAASCTIMAWIVTPWRPGRPAWAKGTGTMLVYGLRVSIEKILTFLSTDIDQLMLGYFGGPALLGVYSNARKLLINPVQQIIAPVSTVALPLFSRMQNETVKLGEWAAKLIGLLSITLCPAAGFLAAFAPDFVEIMLGPEWGDAVPVFQIMSFSVISIILSTVRDPVFLAINRVEDLIWLRCWSMPIRVIIIPVAAYYGVIPLAAAVTFLTVTIALIGNWQISRRLPVSQSELLMPLVVPLIATVIAFVACSAISDRLGLGIAGQFLSIVVFFSTFFMFLLVFQNGRSSLNSLISLAVNKTGGLIAGK